MRGAIFHALVSTCVCESIFVLVFHLFVKLLFFNYVEILRGKQLFFPNTSTG